MKPLLPIDDVIKTSERQGLPYSFSDYLQLVDWSGHALRNNKRGAIPSKLPSLLARLNIPPDQWLTNSHHFEKIVHRRFRKPA